MPDMSNLVWRAEGQMLGRSAVSKDSHDAIVCVCVNHLNRCKTSIFFQFTKAGGPSMYCERWSNEAASVHADITADDRDVPAFFMSLFSCHFSAMGRG